MRGIDTPAFILTCWSADEVWRPNQMHPVSPQSTSMRTRFSPVNDVRAVYPSILTGPLAILLGRASSRGTS